MVCLEAREILSTGRQIWRQANSDGGRPSALYNGSATEWSRVCTESKATCVPMMST